MLSALNINVKHPGKRNSGDGDMKPDNSKKLQKSQVEDLIRSVMSDYMMHHALTKTEKTKNVQNLANVISEYLSAFVVVGYDMNGAPLSFIHAKNQMDADALSAAINRFLFHAINQQDEK